VAEVTEKQAAAGKAPYLRDMDRMDNTSTPAWLRALRDGGAAAFLETPFPHAKLEAWRQVNVAPVVETLFTTPVHGDARAALTPADIAPWAPDEDATWAVFVDGVHAPGLGRAGVLPEGCFAGSLLEAAAGAWTGEIAGRIGGAAGTPNAFSALNTAFAGDGAFLYVPKGVELTAPVHFLFVSARTAPNQAAHPRVLVVLGDNARANVAVEHVALDGAPARFNNVVEEIFLGQGAELVRQEVIEEGAEGRRVGLAAAVLGRDSRLYSHTVSLSGAWVRGQTRVRLADEGAEIHLNGLYLNRGTDFTNHDLHILHDAPHCASRIAYRGILDGASRAVFVGKVHVPPHAQQTDSMQLNKNLLLSPDARVDTKPQLEIYADDVKCTHGATVGGHPDEVVFYFRSRGLDEKTARAMLTYGFAGDMIGNIPNHAVRRRADRLVADLFSPASAKR
jgi:Fe-S cluster assembly protein SufD